MSKFVSVKDSDGNSFSHTFSSADWSSLQTLNGSTGGSVSLSDGSATTDGNTVSITLKSPGGSRTYCISVRKIFS